MFWFGVLASLVGLLLLVAGQWATSLKFLPIGLFVAYFARANKKPRVLIDGEMIILRPNPLAEPKTVSRAALASVDEHLEFHLKDGTSLKMPWREFSKKTRQAILDDVRSLLTS